MKVEGANNAMPEKDDPVRLTSQNIRESIFRGAIQGAMAWIIYAIVECCFLSILPWIIKPTYCYLPLHWGFTALLFAIYLTIGLILGGLCGLCLFPAGGERSTSQRSQVMLFLPSFAKFTFVFIFAANLIAQLINQPMLHLFPPLSVSLLLTVALALSATSYFWFERLLFLTNPWTISILLLGLPWITHELLLENTRLVQASSALAYFLVTSLIAFCIQKIIQTHRMSNCTTELPSFRNRAPFSIMLAGLFALGISFFLHQEPHVVAHDSKSSTLDPSRPNIILITMDAVRADHLSLYGYGRNNTPKLKEFSEEASLFTNAIASGDMTLSSVASIFTGVYARRHGAHYHVPRYPWGRPLADEFQTLSEILSRKGYFTFGIVANYAYISHDFGLDRGFQYYDQRAAVPFLGKARFYSLRERIRNILTHFASPSDFDQMYRRAEDINREVFTLLQKTKKDGTRFFLFVNYMDAHDPYIPPPPFDTIFPGKIKKFDLARYYKMAEEVLKLERKMTQEEYLHLVSQYDGGIAYIDDHIGKLIGQLKNLGLYKNCLIIITSDHGEVFGERGLVNHGVSVYQNQVHVPLIIKYPDIHRNAVVNDIVSLCDLMPTILDVLGFEIREDIDGESLLRLKHDGPRKVISESFPKGDMFNWHMRFQRVERAIFSGHFKFINSTAGKHELYDLSKDPSERENLYNGNGGMSKELEPVLNRWLSEVKEESGLPRQLDKGTLDRLKSLGYIK